MAPLKVSRFTHKVAGVTERQKGIFYSPFIGINLARTIAVPHQHDTRLPTQTRKPLAAHPVVSPKPPTSHNDSSPPRPTNTPHNAARPPPAPPAAKPVPEPPAPVQTRATTVLHPISVLGVPTTRALPVPKSTATNAVVPDQESEPNLTPTKAPRPQVDHPSPGNPPKEPPPNPKPTGPLKPGGSTVPIPIKSALRSISGPPTPTKAPEPQSSSGNPSKGPPLNPKPTEPPKPGGSTVPIPIESVLHSISGPPIPTETPKPQDDPPSPGGTSKEPSPNPKSTKSLKPTGSTVPIPIKSVLRSISSLPTPTEAPKSQVNPPSPGGTSKEPPPYPKQTKSLKPGGSTVPIKSVLRSISSLPTPTKAPKSQVDPPSPGNTLKEPPPHPKPTKSLKPGGSTVPIPVESALRSIFGTPTPMKAPKSQGDPPSPENLSKGPPPNPKPTRPSWPGGGILPTPPRSSFGPPTPMKTPKSQDDPPSPGNPPKVLPPNPKPAKSPKPGESIVPMPIKSMLHSTLGTPTPMKAPMPQGGPPGPWTPPLMPTGPPHGSPPSNDLLPPPSTSVQCAQTTQALPVLTPTVTNAAVGDQGFEPTLTAPPARIQSGDVGNARGKEITVEVSTTIVTSGVFTTSLTTVLPNGQTSVVVRTTTGIHTITTTTAVPTQIGAVSSKSGPPAGAIGGVIGAIAIVILALIAFCIRRHKRRRFHKTSHVESSTAPSTSGAISIVPRPFLGTPSPKEQPAGKRERGQLESPHPLPRHNRENDQGNADPFRDPETIQGQEELVVGARNALDRLQELTREAEEELRELGNRARCGELSDSERERLDEIKRTTGLTIAYDLGRPRTVSSATSFLTPPPSYRSD